MDDLKDRYTHFAGWKYEEYVLQIRQSVIRDLISLSLDGDFYVDHSYYVIDITHPAYFTYMGLFLTMSDPLLILPKLEYHLSQFLKYDKQGRNTESFLSQLEFTVCTGIRTAKFPEDYHIKHEKILNWIYQRRDTELSRNELNIKLDALISSINRFNPTQKISKEILNKTPKQKITKREEVVVASQMIKHLTKDLSGYINQDTQEVFSNLLKGEADESLVINFDGQANQLIDVFRIYHEAGFIKADKRTIANWIVRHFMYKNDKLQGFVTFSPVSTERLIYDKNPLDKRKRVELSNLPKRRMEYYVRKPEKMSSDGRSDA
jgi:hypothetical protein